jgi:hypothetical protein
VISHHTDPLGLVTTYRTTSGEVGIGRRTIVVDRPEIFGYAAGESHFEIVEAVFVAADDADRALFVLTGISAAQPLAEVLSARGIAFRLAGRLAATGATPRNSEIRRRAAGRIDRHRTIRGTPRTACVRRASIESGRL